MSSRGYGFVAAILILVGGSPHVHAQSWHLDGRGVDVDLGETPIVTALKVRVPDGVYSLTGPASAGPIAAVVFPDGDRHVLAAILPRIPARQAFSYAIQPRATSVSPASGGIQFRAHRPTIAGPAAPTSAGNDGPGRPLHNLLVTIDDRPMTEYRVDVGNKPFFFPLIGPTGVSFTRAYPMEKVPGEDHDHPHQRSFWFTHGSVNGVDFWSETKGAGTIREMARRVVVEGPVLGRLWTRNAWLAPGDRKVCEDERTATFYHTQGRRIIDFDVTVHATDGPVTFGDTKEGMFGLRVASSMDVDKKKGGRITNAQGLTDAKAWGQAAPWVDYVGPIGGKTAGIAILNHPESFRYPTTWHVRTYGLFAANPFGWHDFNKQSPKGDHTVPAGQAIRFRYRVILHDGKTATSGMPELFRAYASPPDVEIRAE